jgi:hypothetical protein
MEFNKKLQGPYHLPVVEDLRCAPGRAGLRGVDSCALIERPALRSIHIL